MSSLNKKITGPLSKPKAQGQGSYPYQHNLFFSDAWQNHWDQIFPQLESYLDHCPARISDVAFLRSFLCLRVAHPWHRALADYERWPTREEVKSDITLLEKQNADWIVYRKLVIQPLTMVTPDTASNFGASIFFYGHAPYINLTVPLNIKKEVQAHLGRTQRKIDREIGLLRFHEVPCHDVEQRKSWYEKWIQLEREMKHFPEEQEHKYRKWLCIDEPHRDLPPWIKLLSLTAGDTLIACGLFYLYDGVFYYYAPVMNQRTDLRKYGPGKLFVAALTQYAKEQGCHTFDFLQGEHSYKTQWNPLMRPLYQMIVPLTAKGLVALKLLQLKLAIKKAWSHEHL